MCRKHERRCVEALALREAAMKEWCKAETYEQVRSGEKGKRRSVFKVDIHLGEHQTPEQALAAWPEELSRLHAVRRESKAEKLQDKLDALRELTQ